MTLPDASNFQSTDLATLWIGEALGPLEQISALSFLAAGNTLTIYTYTENLKGVPPGVVVSDAREIMSGNPIVRHRKTGSPALHSDLFRFRLMQLTPCIWVDLDIVARVRIHVDGPSSYLFGWESDTDANGAVLRLPPESPALRALLSYDLPARGYPPFFSNWRKLKYFVRSFGRGMTIEEWPWGALGPRGLTWHLRASGEIRHALPVSVFYRVPLAGATSFLQAADALESRLDEGVWALHFWGSQLRRIILQQHGGQIPEGSWMDVQRQRMMDYSGLDISRALT